ncbi:MAG TPA: HD-GYP domain-containing protein [Acidimicrobiia bacterium]|nr:HD-GYP domain-containing protein [Acidimicrobiia bacterium]
MSERRSNDGPKGSGTADPDVGEVREDTPESSPSRWDPSLIPDPTAALEAQLLVFAKELGEGYQRERERAQHLERALDDLRQAYLQTVRSLALVVEAKDATTGQHIERCRLYGMALLAEMGLADENREAEFGFLLHDCGKVGIPESVLNKPGPLTAAEWRVMRTHPIIGYQLVADIPFLRTAALVVRCHHEMFDGTGYPAGLRGEEIPLAARVFSVVDAFDAMTADRPYRAALPLDAAVEELQKMTGTQFDPEVVRVFAPLSERLLPRTAA